MGWNPKASGTNLVCKKAPRKEKKSGQGRRGLSRTAVNKEKRRKKNHQRLEGLRQRGVKLTNAPQEIKEKRARISQVTRPETWKCPPHNTSRKKMDERSDKPKVKRKMRSREVLGYKLQVTRRKNQSKGTNHPIGENSGREKQSISFRQCRSKKNFERRSKRGKKTENLRPARSAYV